MNSSMCFTLIGRDNIFSGIPFPFIGKGIKVYKFNLVYVASIKWVVELPFNARLHSSTRSETTRLTSVKEIDIVQLIIVNQAELKLFPRVLLQFLFRWGSEPGASIRRHTRSYYPKRYWELLPKEILGAITQRDTESYYPERYYELLPKEILGAITQRETGMSYGKMKGNLIDGKSISSEMRPYGSTMLSTRTGKFSISSERKQLRHATWGAGVKVIVGGEVMVMKVVVSHGGA
ncbi:hypothetical protein Tco_0493807 [Tanacetum coccineum]